jgi:hypothetical protein
MCILRKLFTVLIAGFLISISYADSSEARTVDLGNGAVSIKCRQNGIGRYTVEWSFTSYTGSPIFLINTQVGAIPDGGEPRRFLFFLGVPGYTYTNDDFFFSSPSPLALAYIRGEATTPNGSVNIRNQPGGSSRVSVYCLFDF